MTDARAVVLARIAAALGPTPTDVTVVRDYDRAGSSLPAGHPTLVDRFAERVAEYSATVHRVDPTGLAELVGRLAPASAVVAPGVAGMLLSARPDDGPTVHVDDGTLDAAALERCATTVTGCVAAIAESGTIALDGGPASGRRLITLVPDHHVCVVRAEQVLASVTDGILALREAAVLGRPLTLVSGPSATSDIELQRVEGVHGPRRLDVVLVEHDA